MVNVQPERGPHSWDTRYFWSGLSSLGDARKLHSMDWRLQYRKWEGIAIKTIETIHHPSPYTCCSSGVRESQLCKGEPETGGLGAPGTHGPSGICLWLETFPSTPAHSDCFRSPRHMPLSHPHLASHLAQEARHLHFFAVKITNWGEVFSQPHQSSIDELHTHGHTQALSSVGV